MDGATGRTEAVGEVDTFNGRTGDDIDPIEITGGEIAKLRLINASTARTQQMSFPVDVRVTHTDGDPEIAWMAGKIRDLRLLRDEKSVGDVGAPVLVVSQFTLYGDTSGGRRPSWIAAAPPDRAEPLVTAVVDELRRLGAPVATGRFRAEMQVSLVNDGPVTLVIDR